MQYVEYTPSLHLRPFIEKIWSLESNASDTYPMEHLLTPNGTEGIIFSYQKVAQKFILDNKLTVLPEVYLLIQPYTPWKVITEGCSGIVGVFLRAGSIHRLLRSSMSNVVGQVFELQSFLGNRPVRLLREQLEEARPEERIALVENFLGRYFLTLARDTDTTQSAIKLIRQHRGRMPIAKLADELGISRQAISRQFAEKIGLSPKLYSRVVQFNEVQQYLKRKPQASWLDVTYQFDYADQSHMIKDFYQFTGLSPKGYAALDPFLAGNFVLSDIN